MESRKNVTLIIPSDIIATGLSSILSAHSEFFVKENLHEYSRATEARLRTLQCDLLIVDPIVFDFQTRKEGKNIISVECDPAVVALDGPAVTEDILRHYDGTVSLYDEPAVIVRKLRAVMLAHQPDGSAEGTELSAREKDILVCVAQGMLNKEIADKFNLSIYTVITHRKNITRKTGIKTVAGLTVYAILNNLIDMGTVG